MVGGQEKGRLIIGEESERKERKTGRIEGTD
jgi:hypothetical protein